MFGGVHHLLGQKRLRVLGQSHPHCLEDRASDIQLDPVIPGGDVLPRDLLVELRQAKLLGQVSKQLPVQLRGDRQYSAPEIFIFIYFNCSLEFTSMFLYNSI